MKIRSLAGALLALQLAVSPARAADDAVIARLATCQDSWLDWNTADPVAMKDFVWQTANLAGFISGCYTNDLDMIRESFEDVVIEPQRAELIPGFNAVRRAALSAGALGCSISGAGPTMFAWCLESHAHAVREAMVVEFSHHGLKSDHWTTAIESVGARVTG